jgi:hypothetical protein
MKTMPISLLLTLISCDSSSPGTEPVPLDTDPVVDTFHTGMIEVVVLVRMPEETEYRRDTRSLRRIYWGPNFRAWEDNCGYQRALGADGGCYYSPRWSSSFDDDPWFADYENADGGACARGLDEPYRLAVAPEDAWMTCCEGEGWGSTDCTDVPACCQSW